MNKTADFDDNFETDAPKLSNNTLAFIALANEYCAACENVPKTEPTAFVASMLRLLPRIYIAATDIVADTVEMPGDIRAVLDEDTYNAVSDGIRAVMGGNDTYLEVFEEDMKYSDTPIGASIAEGLADIFQVLYDFLETVRTAPNELINDAMYAVRDSFDQYWAQTLTNVLRALNAVKYSGLATEI